MGVPLIRELDLLGPGGSELGLALEFVEEISWAWPCVGLVDAKHAAAGAGDGGPDAQGCTLVLRLLLACHVRRILLERPIILTERAQVLLALGPYTLRRGMMAVEVLAEATAVIVEYCDRWRPASCRIEAGRRSLKTFELPPRSSDAGVVVPRPVLPRCGRIRAPKVHARLPQVPIADLVVHLGLALQFGIGLRRHSVLFGYFDLRLGQVGSVAVLQMRDLDEILVNF